MLYILTSNLFLYYGLTFLLNPTETVWLNGRINTLKSIQFIKNGDAFIFDTTLPCKTIFYYMKLRGLSPREILIKNSTTVSIECCFKGCHIISPKNGLNNIYNAITKIA